MKIGESICKFTDRFINRLEVVAPKEGTDCVGQVNDALIPQKKVHNVALATLRQLGLTLAADLVLMANFTFPVGAPLLAGAMGLGILVVAKESLTSSNSKNRESLFSFLRQGAAITLGMLCHTAGPGYFLHELGHATVALLLFKKAEPAIVITPFVGGETVFNSKGGLTVLGRLLGYKHSVLAFTAAGFTATTLAAMGQLELAERLPKHMRWLKLVLTSWAVTQMVSETFYGIAALLNSNKDHTNDFRRLWALGSIHPLVAVGSMLSLLFIQKKLREV